MKKIYYEKRAGNVLIKYVVKAVLSTIICVALYSLIISRLMLKFDLDLSMSETLSFVICGLTSATTAILSVFGIKNNGLILGATAQIPLLFYSLLNVIFNENSFIVFLVKAIMILAIGMLCGYLASQKSKKLRIK